ncbi:MAG: LamG domain-containing protein, partial [Planctomycetes bacterium]|nr:LamG domain-containing protein [Planctomycetota bacterium]
MKMPRFLLLLGLAAALGGAALAYESPGPKAPVPEHSCPWVEMNQPDIHTLFLWKFSSGKDRDAEVGAILDKGDLEDLLHEKGTSSGGLVETRDKIEPKLNGDAKRAASLGRFGGGLVLGGAGYAEGVGTFSALLGSDGGFTLDFWFRGSKAERPSVPADGRILLALPDSSGKPLVSVAWSGAASAVLAVAGVERLRVPVRETADGWHHLALIVDAPRGQPDSATLSLTVDGVTAKADRPDPFHPIPWFRGVPARLGPKLFIGGAPGQPGLQGVVDEIRLTKGVKHMYPWNPGAQERTRRREEIELRPPFFRSCQVLTRFRFDGDLKPDAFAGLSWTGRTDAARSRPGIQGQALDLSGVDRTGFAMKGFYILPEKEGTVEFWFRPLDWNNFYVGEYDGRDVQAQWLMTLTAKDALYATPSKNIEVMRGRACRDMKLRWQPIHPGVWTHVLVSVKDGGPTVYVNGQPQKLWQAGLVLRGHPHSTEPLKKWRERTGGKDGDDTWTLAFVPSHTLLDEFTVYASAMSQEEAWNAYARWLPDAAAQMKPLPAFRVDFDYFAHSWDRQERLVIRLACLPVGNSRPASADLEVRDEKGETLLSIQKQPLDAGGCVACTLRKALSFGRYPVVVRSRGADGAVLKEEKQEYVREKPAWLGNTLGKDRTVPPPWTPIAVDGRKLRMVDREIELGANGLPSRIETLKQPVLAAPVTVRAGNAELTGQGPIFTETAPDRVAWKTALGGAGLTADLDAWMEFDGLLYCAIALKPAAGAEATVEDLDVDFPMAADRATQLLANGGGNDFRASWIATLLPDGKGSVWRSSDKPYPAFCRADGITNFMPHIWLGTDDAGLYFGAENDKGWTVDGPLPAQEVLRGEKAVTLRMNIIREPAVIPASGRRFHFVLLPTPAKPEPPDWRRRMLGGVNFASVDSFGGFNLKTNPADPTSGDAFRLEPHSWEYAAAQAKGCREKYNQGLCILYSDMSWPGFGPSFRDWNHDTHAGTGRLALFPEMEDYMVWAVNEFLKRGVIDGVYWDDASVG